MINLPHEQVKTLLKKYKIPIVASLQAKTKDEASKAAEKIGYPVVLKAISKDITHKTEIGGVETGLRYKSEVESAFDRISKNLRLHKKTMQGVLVQKMSHGYEVIIGGTAALLLLRRRMLF